MAKQVRLRTTQLKPRPRPARRVARPEPDEASSATGPTISDPRRLAAEVARLEGELAAMRARVGELEAHAESDPLTGIMNRRGFERELKRAVAYVRRYGVTAALVYLDLDGFKPINDRHGHAAGDAVLLAVAAALVAAVRASDTVARIGGDEFAVLMWNVSPDDARRKADALERGIAAARVAWAGERLAVGATAGVAELSADEEAAGVLARADAAMYARKRKRQVG